MMRSRRFGLLGCAGVFLSLVGTARAWDPAETHAGLTEEAVSSSKLHRVLTQAFGRGLGLWETLRLSPDGAKTGLGRGVFERMKTMDSAGGYLPNQDGSQSALAWVVAGSVLEKTPPERARHHFVDVRTQKGLQDDPGLSGTAHALALSFDEDTSARDLATGGAFDLSGMSALEWVRSPKNELGLPRFWGRLWDSATATAAAERESALVESLLALGGVLCVLQDSSQPAYARNDVRGEFLADKRGSGLEAFVRARYGRVALPHNTMLVERPSWESYFWSDDGKGLSQIAGTGFFSGGTLPADTRVAGRSQERVSADATASLRYSSPTLDRLLIPGPGKWNYLRLDGRRIAKVSRVLDHVHFELDDKTYEDASKVLVPAALSYSAGLVNHLMRGELDIAVDNGKAVVHVKGLGAVKSVTEFVLLFEDGEGIRTRAPSTALDATHLAAVAIPAGVRKLVAAWHGEDAAGEVVVIRESVLP